MIPLNEHWVGVKTVWIFSDRIRDRICLEEFKSIRIRVQIFNIRYRIRIRIIKSHIYDVDIQSYPIRHGWQYPYSNPNPDRNIKTNVISVISVRIRSVFIHTSKARKMKFASKRFIMQCKEGKLLVGTIHPWFLQDSKPRAPTLVVVVEKRE